MKTGFVFMVEVYFPENKEAGGYGFDLHYLLQLY